MLSILNTTFKKAQPSWGTMCTLEDGPDVIQEEDCVQENENETLTAKADDEVPSEASPSLTETKKNRRALWIVLGLLGLCLTFGLGAVAGGGRSSGRRA